MGLQGSYEIVRSCCIGNGDRMIVRNNCICFCSNFEPRLGLLQILYSSGSIICPSRYAELRLSRQHQSRRWMGFDGDEVTIRVRVEVMESFSELGVVSEDDV